VLSLLFPLVRLPLLLLGVGVGEVIGKLEPGFVVFAEAWLPGLTREEERLGGSAAAEVALGRSG